MDRGFCHYETLGRIWIGIWPSDLSARHIATHQSRRFSRVRASEQTPPGLHLATVLLASAFRVDRPSLACQKTQNKAWMPTLWARLIGVLSLVGGVWGCRARHHSGVLFPQPERLQEGFRTLGCCGVGKKRQRNQITPIIWNHANAMPS